MKIDLGMRMVRKRVSEEEAKADALILAERKERREKRLAEARKNPKPPCFIVTWFRGHRTIATI